MPCPSRCQLASRAIRQTKKAKIRESEVAGARGEDLYTIMVFYRLCSFQKTTVTSLLSGVEQMLVERGLWNEESMQTVQPLMAGLVANQMATDPSFIASYTLLSPTSVKQSDTQGNTAISRLKGFVRQFVSP